MTKFFNLKHSTGKICVTDGTYFPEPIWYIILVYTKDFNVESTRLLSIFCTRDSNDVEPTVTKTYDITTRSIKHLNTFI